MEKSQKPRVLVTHWVHHEVLAYLESTCEVIANETRATWPRDTVLDLAADCDAMMAFMPDRVDEAFLRACPRLRIIAAALKGPDNFDLQACTRHGVWFTVVPDLLSVPTAELAIGLMIALGRNFLAGDAHVRSGRFEGWRPRLYGAGLNDRTLGIIGLGAVGRAIAERAAAFDMKIVYCDPHAAAGGLEHVDLEQLLRRSDYVMPLAHLTRETHHMIDVTALARMKRGARLINVGRGGLVDEAAVAASIASGQLAGYAADVFEMEDSALEARPRTVHRSLLEDREHTFFTPHLGSAVEEARLAIATEAAENILDALSGQRPRGAMNEVAENIAA